MTRARLRRLFLRHKGSMSAVARDAGVSKMSVSLWFAGRMTSAKVQRVVVEHAPRLLEAEKVKRPREREIISLVA